jgi:hypothetical protein
MNTGNLFVPSRKAHKGNRPAISHRLHDRRERRRLGREWRSEQHPSDKAVRPGSIGDRRFAAFERAESRLTGRRPGFSRYATVRRCLCTDNRTTRLIPINPVVPHRTFPDIVGEICKPCT